VQHSNSTTSSEHFLVISEHFGPTLQRTVNILLFISFIFYFFKSFGSNSATVQQSNKQWAFFSYFRSFRSNITANGEYFFNIFHWFSTISGQLGPTLQQTMRIFLFSSFIFYYLRSFPSKSFTNSRFLLIFFIYFLVLDHFGVLILRMVSLLYLFHLFSIFLGHFHPKFPQTVDLYSVISFVFSF
jgi:hypothetical protein